jgi:hypothetical protein
MDLAVLFESLMLVIFGCSWPANIYKSITSRTTLGKSLLFEILIIIGYLFGLASKVIIYNRMGVLHLSFWFCILDISMVLTDICLYFRNLKIDRAEGRI